MVWFNWVSFCDQFRCVLSGLCASFSSMSSKTKFVLIGSGLAGGLLAAYLGRRGYEVDLYERRADPREGKIVGGGSINLAISTRGVYALGKIGIADEGVQNPVPKAGRMIPGKSGGVD